MTQPSRALLWQRLDTVGTDLALVDERPLVARGVTTCADPAPFTCRYELATDANTATTRLYVTTEGAGWRREVRLDRSPEGWRVATAERGDLDALPPGIEDPDRLRDAVDVDLEATALTNTLPIRRLGLLGAPSGAAHPIVVAWVRVPSLVVMPVRQVYTVVTSGMIRYASGTYTADLSVDSGGFVTHYPGYATLAPRRGQPSTTTG